MCAIKQNPLVDRQLMEQGAFSPLEWLFSNGCLHYSNYESWRRGEFEYLDARLHGNYESILLRVKEAVDYAVAIGLIAQEQSYGLWHHSEQQDLTMLRMSADDATHELLARRYIPARDVPQMDIFIDNPVVVLTNDLRMALGNRNITEATTLLGRLYEQSTNHPQLADFNRLLTSMQRLESPLTELKSELQNLQQVDPIAKHLLRAQSRDYLIPLWRRLATALQGITYNSDEPELHVSFALLQIQDFEGVIESVQRESQWRTQFSLCLRLTEAAYYSGDDTLAISVWCYLCWHNPQQAAQILDAGKHNNPLIESWWHKFMDTEELLVSTDQLPVTDFPAWLLIKEPGLVHQLPEQLPTGNSAGERIYILVHQLILARHTSNGELEMELRKKMFESHPGLFLYLKSSICVSSLAGLGM